jgi:hypothetical protein
MGIRFVNIDNHFYRFQMNALTQRILKDFGRLEYKSNNSIMRSYDFLNTGSSMYSAMFLF